MKRVLNSMEGDTVNVKWDREWYPATILHIVDEESVEVFFDNPDFPNEIVSVKDIKVITNVVPGVKSAGAFDWEYFLDFVRLQMGTSEFVKFLKDSELAKVELKSSLFSNHARQRAEERYHENRAELSRSLKSNLFLAFREYRRQVICGDKRLDCTPDLRHIFSLQSVTTAKANKRCNQRLNFSNLEKAIEEWNSSDRFGHDNFLSVNFNNCKVSDIILTTNIITTTSRFVLSEDLSRIVTVIPLKRRFGEWKAKKNINRRPWEYDRCLHSSVSMSNKKHKWRNKRSKGSRHCRTQLRTINGEWQAALNRALDKIAL